jgi:hypothetical protein
VVDVIFDPMKGTSYNGMTLYCGDQIRQVLYPAIPIEHLMVKKLAPHALAMRLLPTTHALAVLFTITSSIW